MPLGISQVPQLQPGPVGFQEDPFADPGLPGPFIGLFVLALVVGVAVTLWRVSMARQVARDSGLDPDRAAAMTLLSDDGLDATYLAASLREPSRRPAEELDTSARTVADRLRELDRLHADGLVTAEEYQARRTAILDSI